MLNKDKTGDINSLEDRLWALANTVSIEEHSISSYLRTHDEKFLEVAYKFRDIRRTHMQRILGEGIAEHPAEIWCMTKHSLAAAMRYTEAASRYFKEDPEYCRKCLEEAHTCVELLLGLIGIAQDSPEEALYKDDPLNLPESGHNAALNTKGSREAPENRTETPQQSIKEAADAEASGIKESPEGIGFFGRLKTALLSCCRE